MNVMNVHGCLTHSVIPVKYVEKEENRSFYVTTRIFTLSYNYFLYILIIVPQNADILLVYE
jgi:hypothetical protein